MKNIFLFFLILFSTSNLHCQTKNFIDKPYIEVEGKADTLVIPNRIFINIILSEKDTKGKKSVEDLEKEMILKLKETGIDVEKNLTIEDMSSNFKKYLIKQTDILKTKSYTVIVNDAKTTSEILIDMEEIGISNVRIVKVENSEENKLQLLMNAKAIENAKQNALSFTKPLNQKVGSAIYIGFVDNNQTYNNAGQIRIRGISSLKEYNSESSKYETNIEFEKIKISTSIGVRFSLE